MTREEFENIYRQHYAKMYRLARTMLYDVDESKDVVSDIFARLLREKYQPQQSQMEGYLMTAVRNRCRDVLCHKSMQERVEKLFLQESMLSVRSLFTSWPRRAATAVTVRFVASSSARRDCR